MIRNAKGIFGQQGAGCMGCAGLGALTSGIFDAPTALGTTFVKHGKKRHAATAGLGNVNVPAACWDVPSFTAASQSCLVKAQQDCNYAEPCTTYSNDACLSQLIAQLGCDNPNYDPNTGGVTVPVEFVDKCNSAGVIGYVQGKLGVAQDGKWGPASQTALNNSGKSFTELAPGCTGAAPSAGGGGGGAAQPLPVTPTKTPVAQVQPTTTTGASTTSGTMAFLKGNFWGLPMYAWLGVGGVLFGVAFAMSRKQSGGYNQGFGY